MSHPATFFILMLIGPVSRTPGLWISAILVLHLLNVHCLSIRRRLMTYRLVLCIAIICLLK